MARLFELKGKGEHTSASASEVHPLRARLGALQEELQREKEISRRLREELAEVRRTLKACRVGLTYWRKRAQNLEKRLEQAR